MSNTCASTRAQRTGDDASAFPVRTCVGCRQQAPSSTLVRLRVTHDGALTFGDRVATGRGAWIHPDPACIRRAAKRGAFARAFRRSIACDAAGLIADMGLDVAQTACSEIPGEAADSESGLEADGHPMSSQR
ncbi:YlxR family protein [Nanchangia anserum]|uniref:YlxR family protein n=1 Tax=Nanchangia anserum TaxID=2692125 RepID=A0A8I0GBM4_9ACTO|nr:YlxR family protein [Nanchangia anserum]MBD3689036.1 YlxR family protein [Nanchangia anserum]QOX81280.1 YlxR family protein [Nanchangia anserum]